MGSKFNKRPVARRKPSVCIAPAGSCLPLYDSRLPEHLIGYLQWRDLDPLEPIDAAAFLRTEARTPGGAYHCHYDSLTFQIGAIVQDNYPTPTVHVLMYVFDVWRLPEWFSFLDVPMPLDKPFDTHLLTKTFLPGTDLRVARFTE